jgi:hypothetical protein
MAMLNADISFMHVCEYSFDSLRDAELPAGESFRAVYRLITGKSFQLTDGSSLSISPSQHSWNAGVMFLHRSVEASLPDVYALTDQLYPATRNHASEQYAFSIILQNRVALKACDDVVYHYWYRVKKQIMDTYLASRFTPSWKALPFDERVADVRKWTLAFPRYLDHHVLTLRDDAIQYFATNQFGKGYRAALRAFFRNPFNLGFIRDVLYHTRRYIRQDK